MGKGFLGYSKHIRASFLAVFMLPIAFIWDTVQAEPVKQTSEPDFETLQSYFNARSLNNAGLDWLKNTYGTDFPDSIFVKDTPILSRYTAHGTLLHTLGTTRVDEHDRCWIEINTQVKDPITHRYVLGHELGHCITRRHIEPLRKAEEALLPIEHESLANYYAATFLNAYDGAERDQNWHYTLIRHNAFTPGNLEYSTGLHHYSYYFDITPPNTDEYINALQDFTDCVVEKQSFCKETLFDNIWTARLAWSVFEAGEEKSSSPALDPGLAYLSPVSLLTLSRLSLE